MNIYGKLNAARKEFHSIELKKTGLNKFAGYNYFELGDFLIPAIKVLDKNGLCAVVSFTADTASMTISEVDGGGSVVITSPMGSAALKGCHEVQNIGAVETYQRRYLWVAALEIVEHDALDASPGPVEKMAAPVKSFKSSPTMGVMASLAPDRQSLMADYAALIVERFQVDDVMGAFELASEVQDSDEKTALWSLLDSKCRSAIKKYAETLKETV